MLLQLRQFAEVRMGFHIRGSVREELDGNVLLLQIRDVDAGRTLLLNTVSRGTVA